MKKETRKIYIYILTDPREDKKEMYVGRTYNPNTRKTAHINNLDSPKSKKVIWIKSLKKENKVPLFDVIDEVTELDFGYWEKWYYELFKNWGFIMTNDPTSLGGGLIEHRWTKKICIESAKKCTSRREFQTKFVYAYQSARKNGWLLDCYSYLPEVRRPEGWWNDKQHCIDEARKFTTLGEWKKKSSPSKKSADKHRWTAECSIHMQELVKPVGYWSENKDRTLEEMHKYKSLSQWKKNSGGSFHAARENGWLPECKKYFKSLYGKDFCLLEAKKYKNSSSWKNGSATSYRIAKEKGWFSECCSHMISKNKPKGYWNNKQRCIEEGAKFSTRNEWAKKSSGSNYAARFYGWYEICCAHMPLPKNTPKSK